MSDIKVKLYAQDGSEVSTIKLAEEVFGVEVSQQAMFDAVMVYQANSRQGTAKTKKRFEVSGGGKKPWRQKGTGRARSGSTRSPIWVGGGVAFGPSGAQNYKIKQNKKQHKLALKSAYTLKAQEGLTVLDKLSITGKTKEIVALLQALNAENEKVLLVTSDELITQGSANLQNITLRAVNNVSVYDLLRAKKLVILESDLRIIEGGLK